jgi:outer membrane protein assembly factor BamE (lipoprotein component of BamABCDE complex)
MEQRQFLSLATIVLPIMAFVGISYWALQMPAVAPEKMAELQVGMTPDQVRKLLGEPTRDRGKVWQYSRMTWAILVVRFGPDGRVVHFEHDT